MSWSLLPGVGEDVLGRGDVQTFPTPAPIDGPFPRSGTMEKELSIPPAGGPASGRKVSKEPEVLRRDGIEWDASTFVINWKETI